MANMSAKHFVLIHGSCHGAWCWYKLVALLKDAGHKVTALDLAASGRKLERIQDVATLDDYHEPLYSFMEGLSPEEKIILVGHSMGGHALSCAMERFPEKIAFSVYVSAFMVGPHLTWDQIMKKKSGKGPDYNDDNIEIPVGEGAHAQIIFLFGNNFMAHRMYQNSPPEDLELAILLVRASKCFNDTVSKKQLLVSEEKYGSVRRAYVIGGSGISLNVDNQKWMIENTPPEVTYELKGADHMAMISKPQELCTILLDIAHKLNSN